MRRLVRSLDNRRLGGRCTGARRACFATCLIESQVECNRRALSTLTGLTIVSQQLIILPYDPRWAFEFEAERDRIARALGELARRIDHHGSTAVPGLAAKPIIDVQVSVAQLNPIRAYAEPLAGLGYRHAPHAGDAVCPFFHRPSEWPHSHHVHMVESNGPEERRTLAFRDYLRDNRDVAGEYGVLKRQLAARYDAGKPSDREAYAMAKTEFIERIVQIALAQGYPREL
jgi:GrpB-like predicted nucleotidyltransferase (UPF0157 family)